ncbi:hypothetical protein [Pusillimonas noertemannii]|uniref:Uncharacterized protein n=1 Tax=Pusillimonas noertemannii TaxID=305977 RepID=A0A2U1CMK8_9BURK|nr:hypothetical protein [Pusillimonas noertemannii]NYT68757.1 hypothetical protein [Pusillimonas noertemannii]PVY62222.1 hypothetical protein C7440_1715 [Pusillimonas noertemannii]TFL10798.1 hypothetical protein CSC72_09790 [Pusillimonas noertemannii]
MKKKRRDKKYTPRIARIPITKLRDDIALIIHTSIVRLAAGPDLDAYDNLAENINLVGIALEGKPAFSREFALIAGGARAMNQIGELVTAGHTPKPHHIAPIRVAVNTIDAVLGRLDVETLYVAELAAHAAMRQGYEDAKKAIPATNSQ